MPTPLCMNQPWMMGWPMPVPKPGIQPITTSVTSQSVAPSMNQFEM